MYVVGRTFTQVAFLSGVTWKPLFCRRCSASREASKFLCECGTYAHLRPRGNKADQVNRKRKNCESRSDNARTNKAAKLVATDTMSRNT